MRYAALFLFLSVFTPSANSQQVNGNINAAFATGKWKESHEGVSLFCARITTQEEVLKGNSNGACFLTEAQGVAKDSVTISTNTFAVTAWDAHSVTAVTGFYADKNGNEVSKGTPGAVEVTFRLVVNLDTHQLTKFVEASTGTTNGYHLVNQ